MSNLKFGRKPPKNAPALKLSNLLTGIIPAHPIIADYLGIGGWNMLGNDQYGDCVAVTWGNIRRLMTRLAGNEKYPSLNEVLAFYKTQNPDFPNEDNGMDIQTALEDLVNNGGPDGQKAVAFAKVDHTNADEVKAAIAIFGYVWTGINVLDINMTQFDKNEPWDYVASGAVDGGHSVITGGYGTGLGVLGGDERFITWAQETSFTDSFWNKEVEEAWVCIWPEHLGTQEFMQGVDLTALETDYKQITGSALPIPTPAPTPTPNPTPTPTSGLILNITDPAIISHIQSGATKGNESTDAWAQHHFQKYFGVS